MFRVAKNHSHSSSELVNTANVEQSIVDYNDQMFNYSQEDLKVSIELFGE